MKIKDLIKELQNLDQDLDVILSSDEEGNSFRVFTDYDISLCTYSEVDNSIDVGIPYLNSDYMEQGYTNEDVKDNRCVVLG